VTNCHHPAVVLVLVGVGLVVLAGCRPPEPPRPSAGVPAERSDSDLAADEVKDYLEGKMLDLEGGGAPITIHKAGITALTVGNGSSVNDRPWEHEVTFLYNSGDATYAVIGHVEHRAVEGKQAFFAFKVDRVAKQ
jgi:hypothetical protein